MSSQYDGPSSPVLSMTPRTGVSRASGSLSATAARSCVQSTGASSVYALTEPMPSGSSARYVSRFWASSLVTAMPRATTPATVAATAATAGTVRVRWRAASGAAYRGDSGSRPASRATPTTTIGTRKIMPTTATTAEPAIANSPLELDVAPYAEPAMPSP